ncbi:MAG: hypothetical protein LBL72_10625 [Candidatus Accumulibacter sp.]|nr:hypothetical protein [Accumulibacter sp.]
MEKTPKSYLPAEEREAILREGGMELVYLAESTEAGGAGDEETAWAWLTLAELSANSLMMLKKWYGPDYIRDMGFRTNKAEEVYGPDWLDQPLPDTMV